MKSTIETEKERSEDQARAQLESILGMVAGLNSRNDEKREEAMQTIQEDALSVEVRSDWHTPGESDNKPTEFRICLCTGGPAVQIIGDLNEHGEPESARLEHQDWGTYWTELRGLSDKEEAALLAYAGQFLFAC